MRYSAVVCILIALAPAQSRPDSPPKATTGTIEGRVTFDGKPPPPAIVQDGGSQPVVYVDRSGGLQYAVVFLPDGRSDGSRPPEAALMNQRHFIFEPQVLAVHAGQTVRFGNADPAHHNVRSQDSNRANTFNIDTGSSTVEANTHRFAQTVIDRPLQLSCDIHPWMVAWIYVFDHPYYAVSKADGGFRINNVSVGRHRLAVRQPSGRLARELAVDVRPGETTRLDVRFTPADMGMPAR